MRDTETLENMCELIVDCPHSTPKWTDAGIIVLRNQNIKDGVLNINSPSFTNEEDYLKRIKRAVPQAGDIVFTREAPMGEVCMIPDGLQCCLGQRQVLLRPKSDVCGEYLFWALQSPFVQHQISWNEGTGSTVSNVRIPVLKALNIPRHHDNEEGIAKVLSDLAGKIELNRQTNRTLEQIAQAIFKSWFVDFEPVKAKMAVLEAGGTAEQAELAAMSVISAKDEAALKQLQAEQPDAYAELAQTAALFPSAMEASELGEIPEGWTPVRMDSLIELAYGKALKKTDRVEGEFPVYGSGGITGTHNTHLVEGPGIIVGRKGTVGSIYWEQQNFYPIDTVFYVKPKDGISLEYVYYLLQTLGLDSMNTDAAVPGLNRNNVYRLEVPDVPAEVLKRFTAVTRKISAQIASLTVENVSLIDLRDTLLPKLLAGDLPITNTDEGLA